MLTARHCFAGGNLSSVNRFLFELVVKISFIKMLIVFKRIKFDDQLNSQHKFQDR